MGGSSNPEAQLTLSSPMSGGWVHWWMCVCLVDGWMCVCLVDVCTSRAMCAHQQYFKYEKKRQNLKQGESVINYKKKNVKCPSMLVQHQNVIFFI